MSSTFDRTHQPTDEMSFASIRKAADHTQETLAEEIGVHPVTVGRWERGQHIPHRRQRKLIAKALDITLRDVNRLFGIGDNRGEGTKSVSTVPELSSSGATCSSPPFPFGAEPDQLTRTRHARLAREVQNYISREDHQSAKSLLRRLATDPTVSPWLLVETVAATKGSGHYDRRKIVQHGQS